MLIFTAVLTPGLINLKTHTGVTNVGPEAQKNLQSCLNPTNLASTTHHVTLKAGECGIGKLKSAGNIFHF